MSAPPLLASAAVQIGLTAADRSDAIEQAGQLLVAVGAVEPAYVTAMHAREQQLSSFVGEGFALPHGTDESRVHVLRPALAFLQFPDGVDWDGMLVQACIAIAVRGNEHVGVMSRLATVLMDPAAAESLRTANDPGKVLALLEDTG